MASLRWGSCPQPLDEKRVRYFLPAYRLIVAAAIAVASLASQAGAADPKAFLRQHCADCHSGDAPEGNMRIDDVPLDLAAETAADRWERIITQVEAGEMPPPEAERPPSADAAAVLAWAKTGLAVAAKVRRAEGGRVAIRRLNRLEYENTLHDLLGLPLPLRDLLPEDGTSDGFDTASAALAISPVHMQRFMDAARTALEAVAVRGPRPETKVRRFSYDPEKDQFLKHPNNEPMIRVRNGEMLFFSEPHGEVPAVLQQFYLENEGIAGVPKRYKIRIKSRTHDAAGTLRNNERLNHPHAKGLEAIRHDWRPRTTRPEELTFSVVTTLSKRRLGFFQAAADCGQASAPEIAEIDCWLLPGETIQILTAQ
jgi:mono/diheme cytochrome c family protein